MKHISKIIISTSILFALFGCDSYLDKQPDEALTLKSVFSKKVTTEKYLYHVFSYMPEFWSSGSYATGDPWLASTDDAVYSYKAGFRNINNGSLNPADVPQNKWDVYYTGIREANIFLANINDCMELTPKERLTYHSEVRFARAFYYFMMMRQYGPVILVGDIILPHAGCSYNIPRNSWDECVEYVERELTQIAAILPPKPIREEEYGKPTSGAALALKSILFLYNASPLFNPSPGKEYIYKDVKNSDGKQLFALQYDQNKWRKAAEAAREVINCGIYNLVEHADPYTAIFNIFRQRWNDEIIFGRTVNINGSWVTGATSRQMQGYGGNGVTQNHVDAYGMTKTGRYPILGYNKKGEPQIDTKSGYREGTFESFTHPRDVRSYQTNTMYVDRDPRFYMNVIWAGVELPCGDNKFETIEFYYDSGSGPGRSHDYSYAGYLIRKALPEKYDPRKGNWGDGRITWPYIRLSEIYLNYAEALNEYDPGNADILTYLNMVRKRAGMPNIEQAYPELNLTAAAAKGDVREMIKRERQVELAFENGHRYFDTRRWMDTFSLPREIYGMNVFAPNQKSGGSFWNRVVVEKRVFSNKNYLYPISQSELDRNKMLRQNFCW